MKTFFFWLLRGLLIGVVMMAGLAFLERDRLAQLWAFTTLYAEDRIVGNFVSMDEKFDTAPLIPDTTTTNRLTTGAVMDMPAGFTAWTQDRAVTGIIILKDGIIRHEDYLLTAQDETDPALSNRMGFSLSKSFLSVLMGVMVDDGTIPDLDAPVTQYVPSLIGSAYDGATIRNVLQMSSGITFDEDYLDFWSDINKMSRVLALGQSMDGFAEGLTETFVPPGEDWQYVSIDTHIIGMIIRGASGRTIPDLLTEKVITPMAPTVPPSYMKDGHGVAFVLGGMNMTTHDYALFGHMVANGGISFGTRIVSQTWIEESTRASANTTPQEMGYGYQWWVPVGATEGQFMARGIYGQYIYIDRPRGVVIAVNGADRNFRDDGVSDSNVAMFRQIAESLE